MKEGREWDWKGQHVQQLPGAYLSIPKFCNKAVPALGLSYPLQVLGGNGLLLGEEKGYGSFPPSVFPLSGS